MSYLVLLGQEIDHGNAEDKYEKVSRNFKIKTGCQIK